MNVSAEPDWFEKSREPNHRDWPLRSNDWPLKEGTPKPAFERVKQANMRACVRSRSARSASIRLSALAYWRRSFSSSRSCSSWALYCSTSSCFSRSFRSPFFSHNSSFRRFSWAGTVQRHFLLYSKMLNSTEERINLFKKFTRCFSFDKPVDYSSARSALTRRNGTFDQDPRLFGLFSWGVFCKKELRRYGQSINQSINQLTYPSKGT